MPPPEIANQQQTQPAFNDPSLNRFFLTPEEKKDRDKGKAIVKAFYQQQTSTDNLNWFKGRNLRWVELLLWCKGSQNMKEFLDYMSVSDANKAWSNIDMTQQRIAAQFVGTLVESMAKNEIYPCVKAIDSGSLDEKQQRILDALFRMHEAKTINDVQQQAGIQIEPSNVFVPDDELSAKVHFELEDQLPKEIRFEQLLRKLQNDIYFQKVLNRKTIFDLTVLNFAATKIEKLATNEYTVKKCVPTNMVYNFFMNDTGRYEVDQIGDFYSLKVKDFRSKFGAQNIKGGLDEKQIFNLAKLSTHKNIGTFNYMWNDTWALTSFTQNRPYDDCSILVFDCEIDFGEDIYYVSKKDSFGKENINRKNSVPYAPQVKKDGTKIEQPIPADTEIIKRSKNTWMRGVYAPYGDVMLYWGETDLIIPPYTDTSKSLSSYTVNIPNNDGEYVPSLFERIMEPLREYTITKLKRKQLIAQVRPSGIRIDVESARNIDLGNGDSIAWEEVLRIYNQTGTEVWSSKGVDPLQREAPPISNTAQDQTIQKIIELTNVLAGIINEIRGLIGVPMYRDGSDVGDRTAAALQEGQLKSAFNVTDFVSNANMQLWEETFYKVCLLHWNDIVKTEPEGKDDMLNTRFDVAVKMKITEYEQQVLEADIQRFSQMPDAQGNPSITLKDAMMIRQIDDLKLARWYLSTTFEENRKKAIQDSQALQQQNAQVQQASAAQAQEQAQQLQKDKLAADKEMKEYEALQDMKVQIVIGSFQIAAKGQDAQMPAWLPPILQQLIPNIAIPIQQENKQISQEIQQEQAIEQMAATAQQQQQNPQQEMQGQPPMQQPQQPQMQQ